MRAEGGRGEVKRESIDYFEGAAQAGQDDARAAAHVSDDFDCRMSQFVRCVEVLKDEHAARGLAEARLARCVDAITIAADTDSTPSQRARARCALDDIAIEARRDGWTKEKP